MAKLLKGKAVADNLTARTKRKVERLRKEGIVPLLAIVRIGEKPGDLSYEKGALKRAAETGIEVRQLIYGETVSQESLLQDIRKLNEDEAVHGVLIFRPLPEHIDDGKVCGALKAEKDVDGVTAGSMAGVFTDSGEGYPPCTAEACMALLDHYDVELTGKKVTVMGRSLVIGKPVAMMALKRNATVTICHSRTAPQDFAASGQCADVVIAAVGKAEIIGADSLGSGQVIVDVGVNVSDSGKLCGDVAFAEAEAKAAMLTPVPGGVGSVTTAVLMEHVAQAAEAAAKRR